MDRVEILDKPKDKIKAIEIKIQDDNGYKHILTFNITNIHKPLILIEAMYYELDYYFLKENYGIFSAQQILNILREKYDVKI